MTRITIGRHYVESSVVKPVVLNVERFIDTRCLIQGNSGAGKSWLMRLLAERITKHVPVIILDPESEYFTLREKFDFVLVGRGGDVPADPRSAGLLAKRLRELQVSAVVDLFDLKVPDRRRFVKLFLESMLDLPRSLWRPVVIGLDEAHKFCPERSSGEAESTQAVIDIMSQGRKRGICGILATQRLSKLHKDAEAEANNVFIGRTWLDIDQKRAGALLGMKDHGTLRDLPKGVFHQFGPAFEDAGVSLIESGQVATTHPNPSQRRTLKAPKPSSTIVKVAAELKDIPAEADEEIRTLGAAKREIAELKRKLREQPRPHPTPVVNIDKEVQRAMKKALRPAIGLLKATEAASAKCFATVGQLVEAVKGASGFEYDSNGIAIGYESPPPAFPRPTPELRKVVDDAMTISRKKIMASMKPEPSANGDAVRLEKCHRTILSVLSQHPAGLPRDRLAAISRYSKGSGGFKNALGDLRKAGYIDNDPTAAAVVIRATESGLAVAPEADQLPTPGEPLRRYWLAHKTLEKCHRAIVETLARHPDGLERNQLAAATGYSAGSGGFKNALGDLRKLGLLAGGGRDAIRLHNDLLD
jgi:hypothetical protein